MGNGPDRLWSQPSPLTGGSFPWGKEAGAWSWHSPPSGAETKNAGAVPPLHYASGLIPHMLYPNTVYYPGERPLISSGSELLFIIQ
jgi:hypothetical protein